MPILKQRFIGAALCLLLASSAVIASRPAPDAMIVFSPGADSIPAADDPTIEQLSAKAQADPGNWISLEAYADDPGSRELNLALAQRRLGEVMRRLAMLGFPAHRIRGTSYDDERITEDNLPMRRVEIRIEKLGR